MEEFDNLKKRIDGLDFLKKKNPILIKRGHENTSNYVPQQFELVYGLDENKLMVGDGKTKISELKGITSVALSPNGKLYSVKVDNDGKASATPLELINKRGREFDLNVPKLKIGDTFKDKKLGEKTIVGFLPYRNLSGYINLVPFFVDNGEKYVCFSNIPSQILSDVKSIKTSDGDIWTYADDIFVAYKD